MEIWGQIEAFAAVTPPPHTQEDGTVRGCLNLSLGGGAYVFAQPRWLFLRSKNI